MRFFVLLSVSLWAHIAYAQSSSRSSLEGAFSVLLGGRYLEAEAGFITVAASAPEGSAERWLGQELAKLCRETEGKKLSTKGGDTSSLSTAFSLLLDGKSLDAQAAFLRGAAASSEGSVGRSIGRSMADLSVVYGQQRFTVAQPKETPTPTPTTSTTPNPNTNVLGPGNGVQAVPTSGPITPVPVEDTTNAGKLEVLVDGAAFGAFSTITGAVLLGLGDDPNDGPALTLVSIGGAVGGGFLGYLYYKGHKEPFTSADAGPISIGGALGAAQGGFSIAVLGILDGDATDAKQALGTIWVSTTVGFAGGILVTELADPSRGDPYLVASSAAWGTVLALGVAGIVQPTEGRAFVNTLTVGYDAGIAAGILLASQVDFNTRRLRKINGYGAVGLLAGSVIGGSVAGAIGEDDAQAALGVFSTLAMVGGAGGLLYGFYKSGGNLATTTPQKPSRLSFQGVSPMFDKNTQEKPILTATFNF